MDDAQITEDEEQRRNICCAACTISKDMFNWFKVLWQLDDNKLQEINGTDYTLYLVFLRYAAFLCAVITMFNAVLMVPLYASGAPSQLDQDQSINNGTKMNVLTVLNISARPHKMMVAYFVALFVFPGFALLMIARYRQKYEGWKKKVDPLKPFRDIDIARYVVQVKNLPIDEGVETLQRRLTSNMLKIFPPDLVTGKSAFLKARVIGDYNYLYKKCVLLKRSIDLLETVRQKNEDGDVRQ